MKNKILILFFVLFSGAVCATDCSQLIGSCEYYLCREKQHSCGDDGYYKNFAYKYCKRSEDVLAKKVSAEGRVWIKNVSFCLQDSAERIPETDSCKEVKKLAIADHSICYIETDFCDLGLRDKMKILYMLKKEIYHGRIFSEGLQVLRQCAFN